MINRFMRLIVFYDLPVITEKDKKIYSKFRRFLLNDGFYMIQFSVYVRICKNQDDYIKHMLRIENNLPPKGNVRMLQITDKQFESMKILCGERKKEEYIGVEFLTVFE